MAGVTGTFGNPSSQHRYGAEAKRLLTDAKQIIARSLGCTADEIVLTANASESNNLAIDGIITPLIANGEPIHLITSPLEHPSIL